MRIYVDADACPVVKETEQVAKKYGIEVNVSRDKLNSTLRAIRTVHPYEEARHKCHPTLCA